MKIKLNLFRISLIAFILLYILGIAFYILISVTGGKNIPEELFRTTWLSDSVLTNFYFYFCIDIVKGILFIYTLIQLLKTADLFIKASYFTSKIIKLIRFIGFAFIIIAIIGFLNSYFYHYAFSEHLIERMLASIVLHFIMFITGLGFLVVEETYKKGLFLKQENDLTI